MKQDLFQLGLFLMFSVMAIVAYPNHRPNGRGAGRPTEPISGRPLLDRRLEEGSVGGVGMSDKLRRDVLANYNRRSYPFEYAWNISMAESGTRAGMAVETGINFHRLFAVDEARSSVDLVVWWRQKWTDPRLSWDPAEYGGLDTMWLWVEGGHGANEVSEIWTPDIFLWNAEIPLSESLADTSAVVSSDGTVYWSRPGRLKTICNLQGLATFPFGEVQCTLEVGSWTMSGLYVRPVKLDDGYSIGQSQTSAHSFPEYTLESIVCEEHTYPPYPIAPEEDWPVLFYHVTFSRASKTYIRGFIFLQIVLNFAGFCCFWIPPTCGERISLAITALLAAVASELVVASKLPACDELTWFAKFGLVSLCFAALALFQSTMVVFFYYFTGTDLWPRYATLVWNRIRAGRLPKLAEQGKEGPGTGVQDGAKGSALDESTEGSSTLLSLSSKKSRGMVGAGDAPGLQDGPNEISRSESWHSAKSLEKLGADERKQDGACVSLSSAKALKRCVSWPNAKALTSLGADEKKQDGVAAPTPAQLHRRYSPAGGRPSLGDRSSLGSTRILQVLRNLRPSDQEKEKKENRRRDFNDFKDLGESERNVQWQAVAASIDSFSRLVIPTAYVVYLFVAFLNRA